MHQQKQSVIVMDSDPQVLKGLVLLLEDMGFQVITSHHGGDLLTLASMQSRCPELLILPFESDEDKPGRALICQLRNIFQQAIPAILLSQENTVSTFCDVEESVLVLSEQIKPKDLRNKICTLVGAEQAL